MSRFFLVFLSWPAFFILLTWSLHTVNYEHDHGGSEFETFPDTNGLNSKNSNSIVYIIRHGEKPEDGRKGLSRLGRKRARCILNLFGPHSRMNISYIIAAPGRRGRVKSSRSIDTVKPLAKALHLEIDSRCGTGDAKCVAKRVVKLQKSAAQNPATSFNILIAGRHSKIRKIAKAFGVQNPPKYPDEYGLTWQIQNGQLGVSHQHCPKLDDLDDMNEDEEFSGYDSDDDIYDNAYEYGQAQVSIID